MKSFVEKIKETIPTLVVFQHSGHKDAADVDSLIQKLREEFAGRANIERVDASDDGEYKVHYKLEEYPTYILFKESQELMRESGKKTQSELEEMIQTGL